MSSPSAPLQSGAVLCSARTLLVVLGDQLDLDQPALAALDRRQDVVLMAEVREEAEHVPSHRQRTALFLSAMRHFALELIERGYRVRYVQLDEPENTQSLGKELERAVRALRPERVRVVRPGDYRVEALIRRASKRGGVSIDVLEDATFTCSLDEFEAWATDGRKSLVMEFFYRKRRQTLKVLVDEHGKPEAGKWNFDAENRQAFKRPPEVRKPYRARPDELTSEVIRLVEKTWPDAPGRMDRFDWPVTRDQALRALRDFVSHRLPRFGTFEDAMWAGEPVLYHSRLASSLNLKLLKPWECIEAALEAYEQGHADINQVEGFVRQIIGWREFIRGVYYHEGPGYVERNSLEQEGALPDFFWTGETEMNCLAHCLGEVRDSAWSHHIPRLMVIGNFALTSGIHPRAIHEWFLAMYVDAVEWVTAPNVIGMSQHADGGVVGTKPYAASGKYIDRMSNYCKSCPFDVRQRVGPGACPFNTFYWDFLIRHEKRFSRNRRMAMTLKNVARLSDSQRREIRSDADRLRERFGVGVSRSGSSDPAGSCTR